MTLRSRLANANRTGRLPDVQAQQAIPAMQQPVVDRGLDIELGRRGHLEKGAERHVDVAGLVPPDILAGQFLEAQAKSRQQ